MSFVSPGASSLTELLAWGLPLDVFYASAQTLLPIEGVVWRWVAVAFSFISAGARRAGESLCPAGFDAEGSLRLETSIVYRMWEIDRL